MVSKLVLTTVRCIVQAQYVKINSQVVLTEYFGYMDKELSLAQNVDTLFFARNAVLKNEYDRLFESVFTNPEAIKSIVRLLYTRNAGFTRGEITERLGISDGGTLTKHLRALLASDFIVRYIPFGLSKREEHYKLIDPFCLFYLHFVQSQVRTNEKYWQQMLLHSQSLPGGATPLNMSALIMWNKSSMRWAYPVSLRPIPHSRKKTMTGRVYRSIC